MKKNYYYHTCPYCNSNNDPGEKCDCIKERERNNNTTVPKHQDMLQTTTIKLCNKNSDS